MSRLSIAPRGPFSLGAAVDFLAGAPPIHSGTTPDGRLAMAFPADGTWAPVGVALSQAPDGLVEAETAGDVDTAQVARILSLDHDGAGFAAVAERDPVVEALAARFRGLRPVNFATPYQAAVWALLTQRTRMSQAVAATARITEALGNRVTVGDVTLPVFPGPERLEALAPTRGVPAVKAEWLRALAGAALDGRLEAERLRALPAEEALAELREIPGVGPFSAELILVRGAGHPDLMPRHEPRVRAAMAEAYGLDADPLPAELARIAEAWRPYRSWVCVLLRAAAATG